MKSHSTVIWFVLAVLLFAGIWLVEKHFQAPAPAAALLLPGLRVTDVTHLQVSPAGAREITATRSPGGWLLEKPFAYPAQTAGIESLVAAMAKLTTVMRLGATDVHGKNTDTEFGFDHPQCTLELTAGDQVWHLRVGSRTAPGDQVYIRVVGLDGAFVTDAAWLNLLPRSANDWRTTSLVESVDGLDWIVITNGAKVIELRRDATNHLWRMTYPLTARADDAHILDACQVLRAAKVEQFVNDDPKADLSTFNLAPAELDVWLRHGTNVVAGLHAGKTLTTNTSQVYVRREGWNGVLAVNQDAFAAWRGAVNEFRDPHLLELTTPIAEIEARGDHAEGNYTLQARSGGWGLAGEKFPADTDNVVRLVKLLTGFRAEFVKDTVTGPGLQDYDLTTPARQFTLRGAAGDTNSTLVQLMFSAVQTNAAALNKVFVKRADEDFVYAVSATDFNQLPENGWEFRERHLWNFSETNIVQVTLHQSERTRQMLRTGENQWSLAPGSQGIINPFGIEEAMHRFGELTAVGWVGRNISAPEKYGLGTNNLSVTIELKSGEKFAVDFGGYVESLQTALAAVTLEGERWAFIFPAPLYQLVLSHLKVPATTP